MPARSLITACALLAVCGRAQTPQEIFRTIVLPTLERDCHGCHGEGQTLGKLDLRTREGMERGGTRGPAIRPHAAEDSLLYQALLGRGELTMPPGGAEKRIPAEKIAAFKKWIDGGAPWTAPEAAQWKFAEADLWAFRPLRKPEPRAGGNPIDAFIRARLAEKGLSAAPLASKRELIRRATFDLTGLPPTPEEADAFVRDRTAGAWPRAIERLLASPRYGERWARHWLDVVRYADTNGYSNDFERPNAWRYRDYVIRAFNDDKPYDQFIREQIAGDEIHPGDSEAVIATGFLRAGPWEHTGMSVEAQTRQMWLDDVTGAVGAAFLGLTTGCARCHDHKFDPIPTADYYKLQAIFATTEFARAKAPFLPRENTRDFAPSRAALQRSLDLAEARLLHFRELAASRSKTKKDTGGEQAAVESAMRELTPEEYEEFKLHQKHRQLFRESMDRFEPKAFAVSSGPRDGETDGGANLRYPKRATYRAPAVHILAGGNLQSAGEAVKPGYLTAVARYSTHAATPVPESIEGRRAALARWIAGANNPLTARVMANRIWQNHFGKGLAADANNLGKMGRKPTHPELLDFLAAYFIEQRWSVKALHRLILQSEAYRRSSTHPRIDDVRKADPSGELYAYFAPRRLEAEELRDSLLAVSGDLSLEAGGPGAFPEINDDAARQPRHAMGSLQPAYFPSPEKRLRHRRTIYMFQQRSLGDPFIEVFNGAAPDLSCERREASTVPTQAFGMLNSQFVHDRALSMAARLVSAHRTPARRIERAFLLAYGRAAEPQEKELSLAHYNKMLEHHKSVTPEPRAPDAPIRHAIASELTGEKFEFTQTGRPANYEHNLHPSEVAPEARALAAVLLGLLNSNEFIYVY